MKTIIQSYNIKSAISSIEDASTQLADRVYKCEVKQDALQHGAKELLDFYAHLETALSEFEVVTNKELHKLRKHILWLCLGLCAVGLILTLLGIFTISQLI